MHEEILLASIEATRGGGVFAFVTSGGISLLLMDDFFTEFIRNSKFTLIVGTDDITNTKTIEALNLYTEKYPNLTVKAFLNVQPNMTFHPKYCWFKQEQGGVAIIGSGNLTQQGLRRNWEAFSVISLDDKQISEFETQWNNWAESNQINLKDINDPLIVEKVAKNALNFRRKKASIDITKENRQPTVELEGTEIEVPLGHDDEDFEAWVFGSDASILIAEIPRGSTRWNQANFDKLSFQNFFGATPGDNTMRLLFRGIEENGELQDTEIRQSVSVKSHNWRFELALGKGKSYPTENRPIGIFVKISSRNFLYMLKMPGDDFYDDILSLLNSASMDDVRRIQFDVQTVINSCKDLPIWNYLIKDVISA